MTGLGIDDREGDENELGEEDWGDEESEELELEDDEPLPWLESDDYEDDDEDSGLAKLLLLGLLGLLAIGAILYALYWFSNRPDPELVADGSTIEAPDGPVKERPDDPGGREFEGTGDVAPGVGEGQTREGQLNTGSSPRPSVDAAGSQAGQASQSGGVAVQVGALSTRASAERHWQNLNRQTESLRGVNYRIMEGQIDSGTVYRVQAVAKNATEARALCATLKSQGIACQVKR